MLSQVFSVDFKNQIQKNKFVVACLDGENNFLISVLDNGKVQVFNPKINEQSQTLNLNKQIENICVLYSEEKKRDIIILSSQNILIAYDYQNNQEILYKEIEDGISCINYGIIQNYNSNQGLIIIGGNCSIKAYSLDSFESEVYWNVVGDNVTCIDFCDFDEDSFEEIIVASEDSYIRIYKGEKIIQEFIENEVCTQICKAFSDAFAFCLANNQVGLYKKANKQWQQQIKYQVECMKVLKDSVDKKKRFLILGTNNQQIDVRECKSGQNVYNLKLGINIFGFVIGDMRGDQSEQLIVGFQEGIFKGFLLDESNKQSEEVAEDVTTQQGGVSDLKKSGLNQLNLEQQIDQLEQKKLNLMLKYESLMSSLQNGEQQTVIQADTNLAIQFLVSLENGNLVMSMECSKNQAIKGCIVESASLFEQKQAFFSPLKASGKLDVALNHKNYTEENLGLTLFIGNNAVSQYCQVFQTSVRLPRFSVYVFQKVFESENDSALNNLQYLKFKLNERIQRYYKWIYTNFILKKKDIKAIEDIIESSEKNKPIIFEFKHLSNGKTLFFKSDPKTSEVTLAVNDINVMSLIVQDLCTYCNINELQSQGQFNLEMAEFKKLLEHVEHFKNSRVNINSDIADSINNVKKLMVKAEDSIIINDFQYTNKHYSDIVAENKSLMLELIKRQQNNQTLMEGIKQINQMINIASNLRVGTHKQNVTQLCRKAIKENNFHKLIYIIENSQEF